MKKNILSLMLISLICLTSLGQQRNKFNPSGTWKFEAPYAPEGYQSGTIVVGQAEKQLTASMSFTGSEFKLPGEKVKQAGDSLLFSVYLEGEVISVGLKLESNAKMSGIAKYSEGEVPLALTKQASPAAK